MSLFNVTFALKGPQDTTLGLVEAITCDEYIEKYLGDLDSTQSQILSNELYDNP